MENKEKVDACTPELERDNGNMTRFQAGVVAFWILVVGALAYQWISAPVPVADPKIMAQKYAVHAYVPPEKPKKGKVYIENNHILDKTPDQYHFRLKFRVKNVGDIPVKKVSVQVFPFRFGFVGIVDGPPIPRDNPVASIMEFVSVPSLKPGEYKDFELDFRSEEKYSPDSFIDLNQIKFELDESPAAAATNAAPKP